MADEEKQIDLVCADCGNQFYWSVKDQKFYRERGFQSPKRCWNCRQTRKNNGSQSGQSAPAQQPPSGKRNGNRRDDADDYND